MQQYEIMFEIHPSGAFGLPEDGLTIVPVETQIEFPAIDTWSWKTVGYGTLSQYRTHSQEVSVSNLDANFRLKDNYLHITVTSSSDVDAVVLAKKCAERFCIALTLKLGMYFSNSLLGGSCNDTEKPIRLGDPLHLGTIRTYNLPELFKAAGDLESILALSDPILERAMTYFYHAVFLNEKLCKSVSEQSVHSYYALTQIILHYAKSIACIVGDPSCGDNHQSQYKKHGIPIELWKRTELIRKSRNNMDVAHYKLHPENTASLRGTASDAHTIATEVIAFYLSSLATEQSGTDYV